MGVGIVKQVSPVESRYSPYHGECAFYLFRLHTCQNAGVRVAVALPCDTSIEFQVILRDRSPDEVGNILFFYGTTSQLKQGTLTNI